MMYHRFTFSSKAIFSAFLALGVLHLTCPVLPVQAQQKVQEYADGWKLINPPSPVHIHDSFEPYFTVDIDTKAINPNLPKNLHPMAHMLNQYEVLQFHPNPEAIIWNDNIRVDYETRTTNIVTQLAPALVKPTQKINISNTNKNALPVAPKYKSKFSFGSFFGSVILGLLVLPIAVIGLVLCSPIIVASIGGSASDSIKKSRKQHKIKKENHQILEIFKHVLIFKQSVDDLQQEFNEKFEDPEHSTSGKPLLNSYNILPSRSDYSLDIPEKSLTHFVGGKMVDLKFQFKQPYPTRVSIQKAYDQSTFKNNIHFDIAPESGVSTLPGDGVEYIKTCTLTYTKHYIEKEVVCSGFRMPAPDE